MDNEEREVLVHRAEKRLPIVMRSRRGEPIGRATLEFDGGAEGPQEAGVFSFWSVIAGDRCFIVRTHPGRTVENRVNEYSSMDAGCIDMLENRATKIVPSTWSEIAEWLKGHLADARHAKLNTLRCEEL